MLDLSKVKENNELRLAVKALSTAFPNCSISTDSRESLDDTLPMIVTIIGINTEDAVACISNAVPGYDLNSADNGDYSFYIVCYENEPEDVNLRDLWGY